MVKAKVKKPNKYKRLWRQINERFIPEPRLPVDQSQIATKRPAEDDPHQLARQVLELHYTHEGILTLRFHRGRWFHWNGTHYCNIPDKEMRARTNLQLRSVLNGILSNKKVVRQTVENVTQALEGYCLIEGTKEMPCWVGESPCVAEGDLLAMENGLLDVEAAVSEEENPLREHTPYWFSVTYLPYEYDPEARCPRWIKFLKEVLHGSRERRLIQEFIGYCLTYDTSYHKALILVGEGANGKSVITEVVSEIPTVKGVAEDVLKAVISGDRIRVEFKYHDPTDARPTARLIFATNELPEFWDKTEGLWRRLLVIPFSITIPEEKQDRKLAAKVCKRELPGLLNWALRGLARLRNKGRFTVPVSSRKLLEQHRLASNPARHYLKTQCELSPDHKTPCEALYHSYASRCYIENTRPLNRQQFGREVRRVFPQVERKQLRTRATGTRLYYYVGLRQKPKTG